VAVAAGVCCVVVVFVAVLAGEAGVVTTAGVVVVAAGVALVAVLVAVLAGVAAVVVAAVGAATVAVVLAGTVAVCCVVVAVAGTETEGAACGCDVVIGVTGFELGTVYVIVGVTTVGVAFVLIGALVVCCGAECATVKVCAVVWATKYAMECFVVEIDFSSSWARCALM